MDGIERKSVWLLIPEFADGFLGCESPKGFEPSGEVVGYDEVGQGALSCSWMS